VALALSGLVVVSVMSFGGMSYASGSAPRTSASAQYGPTSPPPPPPPSGGGKGGGQTPGGKTPGGKGTGGQGTGGRGGGVGGTSSGKPGSGLPFTGLTLWIPLAGGIVLMVLGVGLRWQGRRRPTSH
jgi:hypothetical protein